MVETKVTEGRFFPKPDDIGEGFTTPDLSDLISPSERQKRINLNNSAVITNFIDPKELNDGAVIVDFIDPKELNDGAVIVDFIDQKDLNDSAWVPQDLIIDKSLPAPKNLIKKPEK